MFSSEFDKLQKQFKAIQSYIVENKKKSAFLTAGSFLSFIGLHYVMNKLYRYYMNYPPGPDFIGNKFIATINQMWHINVAITYGPIVLMDTFRGKTLLINDSNIARELLSRKDLNDRDDRLTNKVLPLTMHKQPALTMLNGREWKKRRQIWSTKLIRMLNTKYTNEILQNVIKNELEPYLDDIISSKHKLWQKPFDIMSYLTFNVVFQANFGKSLNLKNNEKFKRLQWEIKEFSSPTLIIKIALAISFPFLQNSSWIMNEFRERDGAIYKCIKELIEDRKNESIKYIDKDDMTFVDYTNELTEKNKISQDQEISDIILMFIAGTDTTASTLENAIILMAKQPDIHKRVRSELLSVIKQNNINIENVLYNMSFIIQAPLFRALIHEILRISCVAKLGLAHFTSSKIKINYNNYYIPKNTAIAYNCDYIHNYSKKEHWRYDLDDSDCRKRICLENWLKYDESNNVYKFYQNNSFLTFGFGSRDCVGKQLAMKELRIIIGYLLLNYKFKLKNKNQQIKDRGGRGIGVSRIQPSIPIIVQKYA